MQMLVELQFTRYQLRPHALEVFFSDHTNALLSFSNAQVRAQPTTNALPDGLLQSVCRLELNICMHQSHASSEDPKQEGTLSSQICKHAEVSASLDIPSAFDLYKY